MVFLREFLVGNEEAPDTMHSCCHRAPGVAPNPQTSQGAIYPQLRDGNNGHDGRPIARNRLANRCGVPIISTA
jgi:hypothetical protein